MCKLQGTDQALRYTPPPETADVHLCFVFNATFLFFCSIQKHFLTIAPPPPHKNKLLFWNLLALDPQTQSRVDPSRQKNCTNLQS